MNACNYIWWCLALKRSDTLLPTHIMVGRGVLYRCAAIKRRQSAAIVYPSGFDAKGCNYSRSAGSMIQRRPLASPPPATATSIGCACMRRPVGLYQRNDGRSGVSSPVMTLLISPASISISVDYTCIRISGWHLDWSRKTSSASKRRRFLPMNPHTHISHSDTIRISRADEC